MTFNNLSCIFKNQNYRHEVETATGLKATDILEQEMLSTNTVMIDS